MFIDLVRKLFITIWFWSGASLGVFITGIVIICSLPFRKINHDYITFMIENLLARFIFNWMVIPKIWSYTIRYENDKIKEQIENKEKNTGAFILASNHSSIIDTLFMALFPKKKTYTYNSKWSMIPIFGWLCVWAKYIGIDKSSPEAKAKIVGLVAKRVKEGYSVMIYPEGTRTKDPSKLMDKIKTGAFRIAKETGRPILPLAFLNMAKAMSRCGIADIADIVLVVCEPQFIDKDFDVNNTVHLNTAIEKFRTTLNTHLSQIK